jgi:hypothetical protein
VLGSAERPVDANNAARFRNIRIPFSDWNRLSDKNHFVTINTFSARKTDENNPLGCDDPMSRRIASVLRGKTIEVRCGLIGEPHYLPK